MKITAKSDYAVRALLDLALEGDSAAVQSRDIASRQGIPHRFLEQILLNLKKAGLVRSLRGARGGYRLARPAEQITLKDAIAAVEGSIHLFGGGQPSPERDLRLLQSIWLEIERAFLKSLGSVTLDDIRNRHRRQGEVVMYHI
ncbi:MAG: RrF2 family transcriptional regulator [Acidobacteria bacterium]|nr:RrF2 family transcriptional regulator [Acidobacteriota bacterium]